VPKKDRKKFASESRKKAAKAKLRERIYARIDKLALTMPVDRRPSIELIRSKCRLMFRFFQDEMERWFAGRCLDQYLAHTPAAPDLRQQCLPFPEAIPDVIHFKQDSKILTLRYRESTVAQVANWVREITTANQQAVDAKNQKHIENLRYLEALQERFGKQLVGDLLELDEKSGAQERRARGAAS
jgi:hypothetical protein